MYFKSTWFRCIYNVENILTQITLFTHEYYVINYSNNIHHNQFRVGGRYLLSCFHDKITGQVLCSILHILGFFIKMFRICIPIKLPWYIGWNRIPSAFKSIILVGLHSSFFRSVWYHTHSMGLFQIFTQIIAWICNCIHCLNRIRHWRVITCYSLQWRHIGCDVVSNHRRIVCLLNRLFRRRSKKTFKLRVTGLLTCGCPHKGSETRKMCFVDLIKYP